MTQLPPLTLPHLRTEATSFADLESRHHEPVLYGVTDGKAIGTYLERKFRRYLSERYQFQEGNVAKGTDFPDLEVDLKVTSITQPQSSCPFRSARQKIYGLGYALLVLVYQKTDDPATATGHLHILHTLFIEAHSTADYQTTTGIRQILVNQGNADDLVAFMHDRFLPVDEIEVYQLAEELLARPPEIGYLTISNALQWRLQYRRALEEAGQVEGLWRLR